MKIVFKRVLIPFGLTFIILPIVIYDLQTPAWIALFYFFGNFFLLYNFPHISIFLHSKPTYVEDLNMHINHKTDKRFTDIYEFFMILIMSLMVSGFIDYLYINRVHTRPIIEIFAIIGGNISIYVRIQSIIGKILLKICFYLKQKEEIRITSPKNKTNSKIENNKNGVKNLKIEN